MSIIRKSKLICNVNQLAPDEVRLRFLCQEASKRADLKKVLILCSYPAIIADYMTKNKINENNIECRQFGFDFKINPDDYSKFLFIDLAIDQYSADILRKIMDILHLISRYNFNVEIMVSSNVKLKALMMEFMDLSRLFNVNYYATEHFKL